MSDEANTTPKQGSFEDLLGEIGADLNKALPKDPTEGDTAEDDKNIEAAAASEEDNPEVKDDDEAPGEMKKSFTLKLDDGTEIEAVDGADLVKSLVERIEKNETGVVKVLGEATKVITAQGALIKSLRDDVANLAKSGTGRKAVLTVAEKPAPKAEELAKAETGDQMTGEEFMAKAILAQGSGRITSLQVAIAESHLNSGKPPPKDIVRAVLDDAK